MQGILPRRAARLDLLVYVQHCGIVIAYGICLTDIIWSTCNVVDVTDKAWFRGPRWLQSMTLEGKLAPLGYQPGSRCIGTANQKKKVFKSKQPDADCYTP